MLCSLHCTVCIRISSIHVNHMFTFFCMPPITLLPVQQSRNVNGPKSYLVTKISTVCKETYSKSEEHQDAFATAHLCTIV